MRRKAFLASLVLMFCATSVQAQDAGKSFDRIGDRA